MTGCGKTYFLITLMSCLLQMNASLLVSAASNKAVCVALEYLLELDWIRQSKRVVLVGVEESVHLVSGGDTPLFMKSLQQQGRSGFAANKLTNRGHGRINNDTSMIDESCFDKLKSIITPQYAADVYAYTYPSRLSDATRSLLDHMSVTVISTLQTDLSNRTKLNNSSANRSSHTSMQSAINQPSSMKKLYENNNNKMSEMKNNSKLASTSLTQLPKYLAAFESVMSQLTQSIPTFCCSILQSEITKLRLLLTDLKIATTTTNAIPTSIILLNLQSLISHFENLMTKLSDKKYSDRIVKELLFTADVVFCTISTSGQKFVARSLKKKKLDFVLIDEAAQVLEPEFANIFCCLPRNLVQVGDFKQLPATVFSMETTAAGRQISCMQRLIDYSAHPYLRLETQYRMHPEIVQFPNQAFYKNILKTAPSVFSRQNPLNNFALTLPSVMSTMITTTTATYPNQTCAPSTSNPMSSLNFQWLQSYSFIDFTGGTEQSYHGSVTNMEEAKCVVQIVNFLKLTQPQAQINIITFYAAQMKCINNLLEYSGNGVPRKRNFNQMTGAVTSKNKNVRVFSVDSFQGSESDIIILSFVRSNYACRVGFLNDFQRLNVALTRAKHLLLCVGDVNTLMGSNTQRQSQFAAMSNNNNNVTQNVGLMSPPVYTSSTATADLNRTNMTAADNINTSGFDILQLLVQDAFSRNKLYNWTTDVSPSIVHTMTSQLNNTCNTS